MEKVRRFLLIAIVSLIGLCLLIASVSALSNLGLQPRSVSVETLSEADKIRLAETVHLRQKVGDAVWPGWGREDIPAILYNEANAFLVGYPNPPEGWRKVPGGEPYGGPWEVVAADTFFDQPYYWQPLADPKLTPQAFTVWVGGRWVSSLQTQDWMKTSLIQVIRQDLPAFIQPVFPYRLFVGQLVRGSDQYISLMAHEAFHAYQGMAAPEKLAAAENTNRAYEHQYPWEDAALQADWQAELDLLAGALRTVDHTQRNQMARSFLELRTARRESAGLSPMLIAYEQQREWLEGLARYAELEIWRQASAGDYHPIAETAQLPDFAGYTGFGTRWSQEIDQITRMAGDEGDGRFYYSGMAQAFLLDWLLPGWKSRALEEGIWLEDLLAEGVSD